MATNPQYTLLIESTLLEHTRDRKAAQDATAACHLIRSTLEAAGYTETAAPDLDRDAADPSWIWQQLTSGPSQDVLWIEAHGNGANAITALPLEAIAAMHANNTGDWGRASPKLLVFGSCWTGLSPLLQGGPPPLAYLIDRPTIVAAATSEVLFSDGQHYKALLDAWTHTHDQDPHQQAAALTAAATVFDTIRVVNPAWPITS
jgi:hypothetical protein